MECDETTLADFLVDGDQIGADDLRSRSGVVASLEDAFRLLDRYPWHRLHPIEVLPDLFTDVLYEVKRRGGGVEEKRWLTTMRRF